MMLLFRIVCYRRFYKEIAGLVGTQVLPANSDITVVGSCMLVDEYKLHPKIVDVLEARALAEQSQMDLVLLKEG